MPERYFRFNRHPATKQSLASEAESTSFAGTGVWECGEPKAVLPELGQFLARGINGTHEVFTELTREEYDTARAEWDARQFDGDVAESDQIPSTTPAVPEAVADQSAPITDPPLAGDVAEGEPTNG